MQVAECVTSACAGLAEGAAQSCGIPGIDHGKVADGPAWRTHATQDRGFGVLRSGVATSYPGANSVPGTRGAHPGTSVTAACRPPSPRSPGVPPPWSGTLPRTPECCWTSEGPLGGLLPHSPRMPSDPVKWTLDFERPYVKFCARAALGQADSRPVDWLTCGCPIEKASATQWWRNPSHTADRASVSCPTWISNAPGLGGPAARSGCPLLGRIPQPLLGCGPVTPRRNRSQRPRGLPFTGRA